MCVPTRPSWVQRCSPMTLLSERLLATLPTWRKLSGPNQLTSWQQFVSDVQEHINPLVSQDHLRTLAQQLHSMGEVSDSIHILNEKNALKGLNQVKQHVLKFETFHLELDFYY